ncbi:hypothetical protein [Athalassotoga saccharophila]|uniref:hypothetical protein n=1 Tax=Athalassotoga saccharophila TaxID=1441386 RepID=UPI00137B8203|nr:hypothetical protein [Athalassotoga saccharophila]BBJ28507.1 hypothetical protein ATHSA_1423 [Athalassotoga saccharophila]
MSERDLLIKRIVEEKGDKAIPALIDLLFEGDAQMADIVTDALLELDCCQQIIKRLDSEMKKEDKNPGIFYLADIIGEKNCKGGVEQLKRLLNLVETEEEAIIVHGSLARMGFKDSEKYLLYELENEPSQDMIFDVAVALSYSSDKEVFKAIVAKADKNKDLVDVLQSMCEREPDLYALLPDDLREIKNDKYK